jgi:hypothetical protein
MLLKANGWMIDFKKIFPFTLGPLHANLDGFDLHAAAVAAGNRNRLEHNGASEVFQAADRQCWERLIVGGTHPWTPRSF